MVGWHWGVREREDSVLRNGGPFKKLHAWWCHDEMGEMMGRTGFR